jgi:hypothetical protein
LKLFPFWDPQRGDPRFEKILASLAPKRGSTFRRRYERGGRQNSFNTTEAH